MVCKRFVNLGNILTSFLTYLALLTWDALSGPRIDVFIHERSEIFISNQPVRCPNAGNREKSIAAWMFISNIRTKRHVECLM